MTDLIYYVSGFLILGFVWLFTNPDRSPHTTIIGLMGRDKTRTTGRLFVVLIPQLFAYFFLRWPPNQADFLLSISTAILFAVGLLLCIWAKFTMKKNWGTPAQHNLRKQTNLVTAGPFRYTRNPIYLGLSIMALTASIGVHSLLFPLVIFFFIHVRRLAGLEEVIMHDVFGEQYRMYKIKVPRFFSLNSQPL